MIAIFSKFDMAGGSERRCVELANGIAKYTNHEAVLVAEKDFPESIVNMANVPVYTEVERLYDADVTIVVNTDCREFSTLDYWDGKTHRTDKFIDLNEIKKMFFLYNFLVSPSQHLDEIAKIVDTSIIVTNRKFYDEITKQDRYERIRHLPRYILGSPIDPNTITTRVRRGNGTNFGCHSKRLNNKWNSDWPKLIGTITDRYPDTLFRLMGKKIDGAMCLKEGEQDVAEFLDMLDVFVFFPDYKREEPWARVIAEAMTAGLPIIALNKGGTPDQVLNWNNGILCKKFEDYHKAIVYLIEHPEAVETMSRNSIRIAKEFTTEKIVGRLMGML